MSERCVEVEFGPERVRVPEGGYYDRFRMNPDLDEVARDPATGNIDFFRRIPKQQVESRVGRVWAPNFFYRMRSVQLLYLAPAARLRAMLPQPLEPLRALPGRGLVALTFFSYLVADNDPYNEVSIAVVVRRPGARGPNMPELIKSMRRRNVYGMCWPCRSRPRSRACAVFRAISCPNGWPGSMSAWRKASERTSPPPTERLT